MLPLLMRGIFFFIIEIMYLNPITLIFINNKLIEPNYVDWKRNLDIVLITQ